MTKPLPTMGRQGVQPSGLAALLVQAVAFGQDRPRYLEAMAARGVLETDPVLGIVVRVLNNVL
jgi:hypothetical protein